MWVIQICERCQNGMAEQELFVCLFVRIQSDKHSQIGYVCGRAYRILEAHAAHIQTRVEQHTVSLYTEQKRDLF